MYPILKQKTPTTCRNDSAPLPRGRGGIKHRNRENRPRPPQLPHETATTPHSPPPDTTHRATPAPPHAPPQRHEEQTPRPTTRHTKRRQPRRHTKRTTRRQQPRRHTTRHTKRHQTPPDAVQRPTTNNQHPIHQPQENHPSNRRTTPHNGKEKDPPHKHDESKLPRLKVSNTSGGINNR